MEENKTMVIEETTEEVTETMKEESKIKKGACALWDATKKHGPTLVKIGVVAGVAVVSYMIGKNANNVGDIVVSNEEVEDIIDTVCSSVENEL